MSDVANQGQLMDDVYRYQRLFYDLTRKYYLLGRDHLISELRVQPGQTVLEVACGTGRNLMAIKRKYPGAEIYGLDISEQMLLTARAKLGSTARLEQADACDFDPSRMFGVSGFDHIVLSYSLSMIPDWTAALDEATRHLSMKGSLHIVDFGDFSGLPSWFDRGIHGWLARFHVTPRKALPEALEQRAINARGFSRRDLYRRYAYYARIRM